MYGKSLWVVWGKQAKRKVNPCGWWRLNIQMHSKFLWVVSARNMQNTVYFVWEISKRCTVNPCGLRESSMQNTQQILVSGKSNK